MEKNRNSAIDILRIACIVLITIIHFFSYSNVLDLSLSTGYRLILSILFSLSRCAVNIFFMISGYYLVEKAFSIKRILKVYCQVLFATVFTFVINLFVHFESISIGRILKSIAPVATFHYWFISIYIIVIIVSPVINLIIDRGKPSDLKKYALISGAVLTCYITLNPFIITESLIGGDHSLVWAIFCYFIGGCIKKCDFKIKNETLIGVFLLALLSLSAIKFFGLDRRLATYSFDFSSNSSLLPFIMSLTLFCLVRNAKSGNIRRPIAVKAISILSGSSLFVYLIQENEFLRGFVWNGFSEVVSNPLITAYRLCGVLLALFGAALFYYIIYNFIKKLFALLKGFKHNE